MALTYCHECGKQVSTEAKSCPSCGAVASALRQRVAEERVKKGLAPTLSASEKAADDKQTRVIAWVITLAVVALLGALVWWLFISPSASEKEAAAEAALPDSVRIERQNIRMLRGRASQVVRLAKRSVEARLLDPESARFGSVWAGGDSQFVACGMVNSKNRFGGYTGEQFFVAMGSVVVFDADVEKMDRKGRALARSLRAACDTTYGFSRQ